MSAEVKEQKGQAEQKSIPAVRTHKTDGKTGKHKESQIRSLGKKGQAEQTAHKDQHSCGKGNILPDCYGKNAVIGNQRIKQREGQADCRFYPKASQSI